MTARLLHGETAVCKSSNRILRCLKLSASQQGISHTKPVLKRRRNSCSINWIAKSSTLQIASPAKSPNVLASHICKWELTYSDSQGDNGSDLYNTLCMNSLNELEVIPQAPQIAQV